jgi:hypothetical protein
VESISDELKAGRYFRKLSLVIGRMGWKNENA